MKHKVGIIVFPGSNCDRDCYHVLTNVYKTDAEYIWHRNSFEWKKFDFILIPGGFSYGDYLRAGAIARFSTAMKSVGEFASAGRPVLGICNGFQILCESGLLPGALMRNKNLLFQCEWVTLKGSSPSSPYMGNVQQKEIKLPIAHGEGNFVISDEELTGLKKNNQIIFTYTTDVNGSTDFIGGITNRQGNVMGMMPHPERASEPELNSGGDFDGKIIFDSIMTSLGNN